MRTPGHVALGAWSGGRFMHFGEPLEEERLTSLLRPGNGIDTVLTADVYGQGAADSLVGRSLQGLDRGDYCLIGSVGHDFYSGERQGAKGFPRFTDPSLRAADGYVEYLRSAVEQSLERCGVNSFDVLLLHNPDHIGYTSEAVWDGMAALRDEGLAGAIGVAPGPANGFTLDLIACLERFGDRIDWAMVILNPLEPWPGELVLPAAAAQDVDVITRVVDYGGLFWGDLRSPDQLGERDHRSFRPTGWIERGLERIERMLPIASSRDLTPLQLACRWNLGHEAVACTVPTLIQESGDGVRPIESQRDELAATPREDVLDAEVIAELRTIGDNTGSMALKGATPGHEEGYLPDRWPLNDALELVGERWGIDPARDLIRRD